MYISCGLPPQVSSQINVLWCFLVVCNPFRTLSHPYTDMRSLKNARASGDIFTAPLVSELQEVPDPAEAGGYRYQVSVMALRGLKVLDFGFLTILPLTIMKSTLSSCSRTASAGSSAWGVQRESAGS